MNNKDLIEDIKAKLKASQDVPYREGAWEKFAAQHGKGIDSKAILFRRLASVAAVGLAILGVSLYLFRSQEQTLSKNNQIAQSNVAPLDDKIIKEGAGSVSESPFSPKSTLIESNNSADFSEANVRQHNSISNSSLASISTVQGVDNDLTLIPSSTSNSISNLNKVEAKVLSNLETTKKEVSYPELTPPNVNTLAYQVVNTGLSSKSIPSNTSRKMSFGDKFQLGLFISPNRTSDQFDVGAGFLVSYAISKKVSLRTGTSYNSYSVGVMKNPMEESNTEKVNMEYAYSNSLIADKNAASFKQEMILPNINAVMGKVESLEIPLDVTYSLNKGLYSSVGVSYSAILNQEREAKYIESGTLQDDASLIPNAAQSLNKVQTKTVKSLQENVNPNGFSGFANFSIGKKMSIGNKASLSLEPFVKIPLGQFRKSDLNYTNSGVRIITSF